MNASASTARWPQSYPRKHEGGAARLSGRRLPCVCMFRVLETRRAVLLRRAGVASTGLSIRCRQSLNSQGISASEWRLAVRRDAHGLGRAMPYPGNRVQLRPSGDRIRSPSHDGEHRRVWGRSEAGLIFSGLSLFSEPFETPRLWRGSSGEGW